jgi:L-arabinonolactonase
MLETSPLNTAAPTPRPAADDLPLSLVLAQTATLGEGVQWHAGSGRWWWTDIESASLHAWTPGAAATLSCRLPDRLGSFAHTRSGRLLLGLAKRLCLATLADTQAVGTSPIALEELCGVDAMEARTRVNDGRCDRAGHFVFGTLNEAPERRPIGSFYQYSTRHGLRRLALPAVAIANSICFSLDGRTMYFCDTLSQLIQRCDYDAETAQVAHIRPFARITESHAWPDGSAIDAEGCLWNAQWGAGQVVRYGPEGREITRHTGATPHSSCPALGGPGGDTLLLTTARSGMSREQLAAQPRSGSLFGLTLPRALAVPEVAFDDQPA